MQMDEIEHEQAFHLPISLLAVWVEVKGAYNIAKTASITAMAKLFKDNRC